MGRGFAGSLCAFSLLAVVAPRALHAEEVILGMPTYGGSACPSGTVSTVLAPDQSVMSIFFDAYEVETTENKKSATGNCKLHVPITVPKGRRVVGVSIDYRGYAYVPGGAKGKFQTAYQIKDKKFAAIDMPFVGPFDDDFLIEDQISRPEKPVKPKKNWMKHDFKCQESVTLKIDTQLTMQKPTPKTEEEAYAALDSADLGASVTFGVVTEQCPPGPGSAAGNGNGNGNNGNGHGNGNNGNGHGHHF